MLAFGQVENAPQIIFAGREQIVRVSRPAEDGEQSVRILQVSAGVVAPVGEAQTLPVKRTVIENVPVTLPEVRAATRFVIQVGGVKTLVLAVPADVLKGLGRLSDTEQQLLGVFDPAGELRGALQKAGVEFVDFQAEPRDCRLVIAWTKDAVLPESVVRRVKAGTALVWVRPQWLGGVLATRWENGHVVVLPPAAIETAAMQYNLVRYAELALKPEAWRTIKEEKE